MLSAQNSNNFNVQRGSTKIRQAAALTSFAKMSKNSIDQDVLFAQQWEAVSSQVNFELLCSKTLELQM